MTIVSLLLYGRAVAILGASGGAAFGALVPALSALLAIPLLDEWPNKTDWVGIVLVSAGVYLASGGPLPGQNPKPRSVGSNPHELLQVQKAGDAGSIFDCRIG